MSGLADVARSALSTLSKSGTPTATRPGAEAPAARGPRPAPAPRPSTGVPRSGGYPGDFTGTVHAQYSPSLDGNPDPGEVVWTWVPYEEDYTRGKDRPVLVVGRDGYWLLGLMLSSKDHTRDGADSAGSAARDDLHGPRWLDIGSGLWDSQGRDSEVRLDRVLRLDPTAVRREGAIMDKALFQKVTRAIA
ncbi:PemK-like, MazF-like toxin of type II toxin-antitoxin system [Sanguibacter gelidistatuariae]|uniref:PemK-like, MazF-like toxin of type II toxin-antitoxin system n=2 Tax=Sanguibacter gelidistatuariae TaxID=1814289 RepID=A0A1G6RXS8_9MICO|nr:PemK-like, MazF-like toxin of type II toxin-antitoxin system [Sanguibacter gelidistatuariae]